MTSKLKKELVWVNFSKVIWLYKNLGFFPNAFDEIVYGKEQMVLTMVNKLAIFRLLVAIPALSLTELSTDIFYRFNDIMSYVASGLMGGGSSHIGFR